MNLGDRLREEYHAPDDIVSAYDRIAADCSALTRVGIRKHTVRVRPELADRLAVKLREEGLGVTFYSDLLEVSW